MVVVRNAEGRRHSLYVMDFEPNTLTVNCLNSYGEDNDPEPKKQLSDVEIYYRVSCSAQLARMSNYIDPSKIPPKKTDTTKSKSLKQTFLACIRPTVISPDANTASAGFNFDVNTRLQEDENSNIKKTNHNSGKEGEGAKYLNSLIGTIELLFVKQFSVFLKKETIKNHNVE